MSNSGVYRGRRRFLTNTVTVVGAVGAGFAAVPFVSAWLPSARAKAIGAPVEVDISKLEPGARVTVAWRGKPVWVVRRGEDSLKSLSEIADKLRDPESQDEQQPEYAQNEYRSIKEEYIVLIGLCTHLGCSPTYIEAGPSDQLGADWRGGFYCPCHGSTFDIAGRVFAGVPAPTNLEVPPHRYLSDTKTQIGVDQGEAA
ncbi:MAG: ubiquinol-cytochrome c reductase iron-sulfur subunit [Pseudomonadota bacterium]